MALQSDNDRKIWLVFSSQHWGCSYSATASWAQMYWWRKVDGEGLKDSSETCFDVWFRDSVSVWQTKGWVGGGRDEDEDEMLAVTGMDRSRGDFRYCDLTIVYFWNVLPFLHVFKGEIRFCSTKQSKSISDIWYRFTTLHKWKAPM